ncbi:MAG: hypothetical protein NTZ84_00170 [Candidatus Nealsonbacteria bacterium]|nr:hypothetical protein [Candidatus Nealsonbacteria bacterium]
MSLRERDMPCWYELSWREKETAILLRVHKDFIATIERLVSGKPDLPLFDIIAGLRGSLGFEKFTLSFNENFGFNDAFLHVGEKDGFAEFLIKIPEVQKYTDEICPECKGSGNDKHFNGECSWCHGKGKHLVFDWKSAYAISASFTVFSMLARFPDIKTSSNMSQLLTIETKTNKEMHGGSLWGIYSPMLCKWLVSIGETEIPEVVLAMEKAYGKMFGIHGFYEDEFRAHNNSGWLIIDCPGDRTGIHPSTVWSDKGCEFSCHNVDSPVQQITLIAGLAALHDKGKNF